MERQGKTWPFPLFVSAFPNLQTRKPPASKAHGGGSGEYYGALWMEKTLIGARLEIFGLCMHVFFFSFKPVFFFKKYIYCSFCCFLKFVFRGFSEGFFGGYFFGLLKGLSLCVFVGFVPAAFSSRSDTTVFSVQQKDHFLKEISSAFRSKNNKHLRKKKKKPPVLMDLFLLLTIFFFLNAVFLTHSPTKQSLRSFLGMRLPDYPRILSTFKASMGCEA